MTLALSQLERSIEHLKSQYDEMPIEYHKHITNRLMNQYNVYIDLLNALIVAQKQNNKLQQMVDDMTIKETQEQHHKILEEFKNTHNTEVQAAIKAVADKYTTDKYIVSYTNAKVYLIASSGNSESIHGIGLALYQDLNKSIIETIKTTTSKFLQSACVAEQQKLQSTYDEKLNKYIEELNIETDAIVNQCKKSTDFHDNVLANYMTKLDTAKQESMELESTQPEADGW